jgi:saccharopine dehydrogenase (NAD+, L-lysine-forming)
MSVQAKVLQRLSKKLLEQNKLIFLYGCYGYTAELILKIIHKHKLQDLFVIAGRDLEKTLKIGEKYEFQKFAIFSLDNTAQLEKAVGNEQVATVLNCAGPFAKTAALIARACIKYGKNYVDISGEAPVYQQLYAKEFESTNDAVILSGAAYLNMPSDCLASALVKEYKSRYSKEPTHLEVAYGAKGSQMSIGVVKTILTVGVQAPDTVRKDGKLVQQPKFTNIKSFDFPDKDASVPCSSMAMSDSYVLGKSTQVPNIIGYTDAVPPPFVRSLFASSIFVWFMTLLFKIPFMLPLAFYLVDRYAAKGPSETDIKESKGLDIAGEASDGGNNVVKGYVHIPQHLQFSAAASLLAALKVSAGESKMKGVVTSTQAFGEEVLKELEQVKLHVA